MTSSGRVAREQPGIFHGATMPLLPDPDNTAQAASLGGLLKVGQRAAQKIGPAIRTIGQAISIGTAVDRVDKVLSDTKASANEKLTVVLNNLSARLKASPLTRTITFGELVDLTGEAGATDPVAVATLLIPQFKDP